jgi:hypothetical protein
MYRILYYYRNAIGRKKYNSFICETKRVLDDNVRAINLDDRYRLVKYYEI